MEPFRAIWMDEGKPLNDDRERLLRDYDITHPVFPMRDPTVTRDVLDDVRARGLPPGLYAVRSWYPNLTPEHFASHVSAELDRIMGSATPADYPFICLDFEPTSVGGILACSLQWRKHRPNRVTDLTIEGHQGGLFTGAQLRTVAKRFRFLLPQSYDAPMTHGWDPYFMARDLVEHGCPLEKIRPFYDAALVNDLQWWDGYAFTMQRLPERRP